MGKRIKGLFIKTTALEMEGIGVIEIILILVIIIGLVLLFKNQITEIMDQAFEMITGDASTIIDN